MKQQHRLVLAFALLFTTLRALGVTVTPAPATFGNQLFLNDMLFSGNEIDTGLQVFSQPSVLTQSFSPQYGGNIDLASTSSVAFTGAPYVTAQVDADYLGLYGVTGRVSSSLSCQVVITGGTPGALTSVDFGTIGQLTSTPGCTACPNGSWLSASALLRIGDHTTGAVYFQLGGSTDTVFQTGLGSTPIAVFTTLNLPVDVPLDVIIGVTA